VFEGLRRYRVELVIKWCSPTEKICPCPPLAGGIKAALDVFVSKAGLRLVKKDGKVLGAFPLQRIQQWGIPTPGTFKLSVQNGEKVVGLVKTRYPKPKRPPETQTPNPKPPIPCTRDPNPKPYNLHPTPYTPNP